MTRRTQFWLAVAVLFEVVNLLGAGYAIALSEVPHASLHGVLALLGAYPVWRLALRRGSGASAGYGEIAPDVSTSIAERLMRVEQSLDAVALEVERIGEGQRYLTRVLSEGGAPQAVGEGAAERIGSRASLPRDRG